MTSVGKGSRNVLLEKSGIRTRGQELLASLKKRGREIDDAHAKKRLQRSEWCDFGDLLTRGRDRYQSNQAFGQWVRTNGFDAAPAQDSEVRSNALWMARHRSVLKRLQDVLTNHHPTGVHNECRERGFFDAHGEAVEAAIARALASKGTATSEVDETGAGAIVADMGSHSRQRHDSKESSRHNKVWKDTHFYELRMDEVSELLSAGLHRLFRGLNRCLEEPQQEGAATFIINTCKEIEKMFVDAVPTRISSVSSRSGADTSAHIVRTGA